MLGLRDHGHLFRRRERLLFRRESLLGFLGFRGLRDQLESCPTSGGRRGR